MFFLQLGLPTFFTVHQNAEWSFYEVQRTVSLQA